MHNCILLSVIFIVFQAVLSCYLIKIATWDPISLGFAYGNLNPNVYIFINIMPAAHGAVLQVFLTPHPSSACKAGVRMLSRIGALPRSRDQNNIQYNLL